MRSIVVVTLWFVAVSWTNLTHAQTVIEAGKTFLLGGEQKRPLSVEGKNIGKTVIEVSGETAGTRKVLVLLRPGSVVNQTFETGELARFRNTSNSERAVISFKITKDVGSLSMRYAE